MQSDIVIGLQFGDEGKGKVVDHLIKKRTGGYDLCVRYNGGPNAGHTVTFNGKKLVTHQVPTGAIHGVKSLIGSSCMVDLEKLETELCMIEDAGVENIRDLVHIAYNCHIIQKNHISIDNNGNDKVGTTGCGMGPAYRDKYNRIGIRASDNDTTQLQGCKIVDPIDWIPQNAIILFEGAQGFMLDINWGFYPYVTSTHCDTGFITSSGVNPRSIRDVYGIVKLYTTYVGNMQYQPIESPHFEKLAILGKEFGSTTGRPRQCNWFNIDQVLRACKVNGVNILVINKCDIIQQLNIFKLKKDNKEISFDNFEKMQTYIENAFEGLVNEIHFSPHKI